ncbi:MAG: hypothetical protein DMG06_22035 [Acidobacteria bacterium]|nr:MAG: hypothetical protein DMG06_22035 [Acidobacteriota bacterium]
MDAARDRALRIQLLGRRQKLEDALTRSEEQAQLEQLLHEVDSALQRLDTGTYGLCEICHEPIEKDWLMADPLCRICLSHLSPDEQRAFEQDLDLASQIQRSLLPKQNLRLEGWEVYHHYEPAGPVSGDYCDLVYAETQPGELFFFLGDVSGKGVAASILMSHLHAIFRSLVATGLAVNRLVERANRVFCESTMSAQFATLICGRADRLGAIEICNAGHCPPLWVRGGTVAPIESTGLPVGIFHNGEYSMKRLELAAGESLFLYTDGLSEARNGANTEYGTDKLSTLVADRHSLSAQALTSACLEELRIFRSGTAKTDDLTIMVIRRVE